MRCVIYKCVRIKYKRAACERSLFAGGDESEDMRHIIYYAIKSERASEMRVCRRSRALPLPLDAAAYLWLRFRRGFRSEHRPAPPRPLIYLYCAARAAVPLYRAHGVTMYYNDIFTRNAATVPPPPCTLSAGLETAIASAAAASPNSSPTGDGRSRRCLIIRPSPGMGQRYQQ